MVMIMIIAVVTVKMLVISASRAMNDDCQKVRFRLVMMEMIVVMLVIVIVMAMMKQNRISCTPTLYTIVAGSLIWSKPVRIIKWPNCIVGYRNSESQEAAAEIIIINNNDSNVSQHSLIILILRRRRRRQRRRLLLLLLLIKIIIIIIIIIHHHRHEWCRNRTPATESPMGMLIPLFATAPNLKPAGGSRNLLGYKQQQWVMAHGSVRTSAIQMVNSIFSTRKKNWGDP